MDVDEPKQYELPKPDNTRLDAIYAQLKNLQSFKDEIMDDLNDFMDDFETQSQMRQIERPQQFEEVVDIVVADSREKANDRIDREERDQQALVLLSGQNRLDGSQSAGSIGAESRGKRYDELVETQENEDKPFWAKFLRSEEDRGGDLTSMVMNVLEGKKTFAQAKKEREEDKYASEISKRGQRVESSPSETSTPSKSRDLDSKMKQEWEKIRKLEAKIGQANRAQEDMKAKMYDHKLRMEGILSKAAKIEEEKKQATEVYDVKNRRGLTS